MENYVHGYTEREARRLQDQAVTLAGLLHRDVRFPAGSRVLEAGCGTGSQTVLLARNNPDSRFVSIDVSPSSLLQAEEAVGAAGLTNVRFEQADIFSLPFAEETFDHVFVCFVLEHLADPAAALRCLRRVLRKGGDITVVEGDHGSFYCHPETPAARRTVDCLVEVQAKARRQCPHRPAALSPPAGRRLPPAAGDTAPGLCRRQQAGTDRGLFPPYLYRHGPGGAGSGLRPRAHRRGRLGQRHR